ncbi:hypothetical protein AAFF_G00115820 [Aldrovandia affinis]|uniref:Uncharacterized protein n=1 Tax=Aldrovandia affinis TaxID=143900 RepID=A0AAD7WWX0_9TELE|nr:hypothetical protein AAFF_G00115820 [Aldrovandia affinis]
MAVLVTLCLGEVWSEQAPCGLGGTGSNRCQCYSDTDMRVRVHLPLHGIYWKVPPAAPLLESRAFPPPGSVTVLEHGGFPEGTTASPRFPSVNSSDIPMTHPQNSSGASGGKPHPSRAKSLGGFGAQAWKP